MRSSEMFHGLEKGLVLNIGRVVRLSAIAPLEDLERIMATAAESPGLLSDTALLVPPSMPEDVRAELLRDLNSIPIGLGIEGIYWVFMGLENDENDAAHKLYLCLFGENREDRAEFEAMVEQTWVATRYILKEVESTFQLPRLP